MTSFLASAVADVGTTAFGVQALNFREIGIGANALGPEALMPESFVLRVAVPALLIGVYALAKERENFTLAYSTEKAMAIGNVLCWAAVVFNTSQILPHVIR